MARRSYSSTVRREQAQATRERVIAAALELFSRDGYGATSLARIAEAADVSIETVRSVGPKRHLLERASVLATFGSSDPPDTFTDNVAESYFAKIATPEEWVSEMSAVIAHLNAGAAGIFRAFSSAAADDPEIHAVWRAQQLQVRTAWRGYISRLDERRWITAEADREDLTTAAWLFTLADTYSRMAATGYDQDGYRRWLEASLRRLLFEK